MGTHCHSIADVPTPLKGTCRAVEACLDRQFLRPMGHNNTPSSHSGDNREQGVPFARTGMDDSEFMPLTRKRLESDQSHEVKSTPVKSASVETPKTMSSMGDKNAFGSHHYLLTTESKVWVNLGKIRPQLRTKIPHLYMHMTCAPLIATKALAAKLRLYALRPMNNEERPYCKPDETPESVSTMVDENTPDSHFEFAPDQGVLFAGAGMDDPEPEPLTTERPQPDETPKPVSTMVDGNTPSSQTSQKSPEQILEENRGLVHHLARKYGNNGADPDDLIQEGNMALRWAVMTALARKRVAMPAHDFRFLRDDRTLAVMSSRHSYPSVSRARRQSKNTRGLMSYQRHPEARLRNEYRLKHLAMMS